MTENRLWILGADDHEMSAIEQLLLECGEQVAYAMYESSKRVHGGNAYKATGFCVATDPLDVWDLPPVDGPHGPTVTHRVECGWDGWEPTDVVVIDHHRPGDPGYGKPPAEFLSASSIGQVCRIVMHPEYIDNVLAAIERGDNLVDSDRAIVLTAAADHCLGAAYMGQCPGVAPDKLLAFRVEQKAVYQYNSRCEVCGGNGTCISSDTDHNGRFCHAHLTLDQCRDQIYRDINAAMQRLTGQLQEQFDRHCGGDQDSATFQQIADLRDCHIDQLPEAACRLGVAYVTTVSEPKGRIKDVFRGNTPPEMVEAWMAARRAEGREVYGAPARGFAGAYRVAEVVV